MKITDRVKIAVNAFRSPVVANSNSVGAAKHFLKYGNGKTTMPNWSQVIMSDQDMYTGFMYGAINIRAVTVAQLATYTLHTDAEKGIMDKAKKERESVTHPYLEILDTSKSFSNYQFWYTSSTYLDLEGLMYVMAIRNVGKGIVGKVQEFKMLNPYNIVRVFNAQTKQLEGYRETMGIMTRDIPKEMIIPIVNLNPFNNEPFAMTDAAKDHQFTLKTATDYTRSAIVNNINAPGIIATDREMEGEELENFKARVTSHDKGEPIFGGGAGSITWSDMQTDLNKAALKDVNAISLQNVIAASGASKTMLGWEESGTTRDTASIQKDNFVELRAMPQLQLIIDAFNQDYKNFYPAEYVKDKYRIIIENPLATDIDEDAKQIENRKLSFEAYNDLVNKGYDREIAARYVEGEMTLEELGKPTNEPVAPLDMTPKDDKKEDEKEENAIHHFHQEMDTGLINTTQASLQNSIINIDQRMLTEVAQRIGQTKNDFESESEIITASQKKQFENELELVLTGFYGIILPLFAYNVLSQRAETYGKLVPFKMNNEVRTFIKNIAKKAATSHINTSIESIQKFAQKAALAGDSRDKIARDIINKYGDEISRSRAVVIARTETNRAFTMSQFQADKQFLKTVGIENAYKKWITRSATPCSFCQSLAEQPPVPFSQNFASIGDELTGTEVKDGKTVVRKMTVTFANLEAGNAHPNCFCGYELVDQNGNILTA